MYVTIVLVGIRKNIIRIASERFLMAYLVSEPGYFLGEVRKSLYL